MVNPHEIFIFLVSSSALFLAAILHRRLALIPNLRLLLIAFGFYYASTVITIVEGFVLPGPMNFLEHLCRAAFPLLLFTWFRSASTIDGGQAIP